MHNRIPDRTRLNSLYRRKILSGNSKFFSLPIVNNHIAESSLLHNTCAGIQEGKRYEFELELAVICSIDSQYHVYCNLGHYDKDDETALTIGKFSIKANSKTNLFNNFWIPYNVLKGINLNVVTIEIAPKDTLCVFEKVHVGSVRIRKLDFCIKKNMWKNAGELRLVSAIVSP